MKLRYVGPFPEVEIPEADLTVAQGETFEVPAALGNRLLEQPDNYRTATRKG